MIERILEILSWFFSKEHILPWIEHHLLYFFFLGIGIAIIYIIILLIKINKDIKKINKNSRKSEKNLLKFLSNKKNKTF